MDEISRIKDIYKTYDTSENYKKLYSPFGLYAYFFISLEQHLIQLFKKNKLYTLENKRILDFGIGEGKNISIFYKLGLRPEDIFGTDILFYRLKKIKDFYNNIDISQSEGQFLPYKNNSFDIVSQFVVFSSILNDNVCRNIAAEMLRVLKDDGMIIWYDSHGGNMMSEHTRSYSEKQIKEFFPNCRYEFKRIIPHSQLSLRLGKYECGWLLLDIIEKLFPFLNYMQLCVIKKNI